MAKTQKEINIDRSIFWLPCMAQDNLKITSTGSICMSYPSSVMASFYHIRTLAVPSKNSDEDNLRGLKIYVHVTAYEDRDIKKKLDSRDSRSLEAVNKISFIPKSKFKMYANTDWEPHPHTWKEKRLFRKFRNQRNRLRKTKEELMLEFTLDDYLPCGLAKFNIKEIRYASFYRQVLVLIYEQIKLHFHTHHFHGCMTHTCSPLYLKTGDADIRIHDNDNPGLLHFIEECHTILTEDVDGLYNEYRSIDSPTDKRSKSERLSNWGKERRKLEFYESCYNLIGQSVFIQSLLNTMQNRCCHPMVYKDNNKYQIYACNIENARSGAEALMNKIKHHHEVRNLKIATRISYGSIALGILSVVLALCM